MKRKLFHICLLLSALLSPAALADNAAQPTVGHGKLFFRNIGALEYGGHNRNFDIVCGDDAYVYVANFEGLTVWDGAGWKMHHTPGISRITDLYRSANGNIWVGGYNVLGCIDSERGVRYLVNDTLDTADFGEISGIGEQDGSLVFYDAAGNGYRCTGDSVTATGRLAQEKPAVFQGYHLNDFVAVPEYDMILYATVSDGIIVTRSDGTPICRLGLADGLCSNSVKALSYDGKGTVWGVTDNGLCQLFLSPAFRYGETDGIVGQVTSIAGTADGLYVGTLQGIFLRNAQGRFDRLPGINLACWQLVQGPEGEILAATAEGVFRLDGQMRQYSTRHTLSLLRTGPDEFLTGETDGIWRHAAGQSPVRLSKVPNITRLVRQPDGGVWAVSLHRKTYYLAPGAAAFEEKDGCPYSSLLEYTDADGRRWHCHDNGRGLTGTGLTPRQTAWLQMLDDYFIQAVEVTDGILYAGGSFGVVSFDLARMDLAEIPLPHLYIRDFSQAGHNISFRIATDRVPPIGTLKFSTRLSDDEEWSEWSDRREIQFRHPSPHSYSLTVRCLDPNGNIVMSEPLPFVVPYPFLLRWYAWLFYGILLLLILQATFKISFKVEQAKQARLEQLVEQRTGELREAQSQLLRQERDATVGKLTKGLIDRILNPMNYINNFSHLTKGLVKDLSENIDTAKEHMDEEDYEDCLDVMDIMRTNLQKIEDHGMATTRILKAMEHLLSERSVNAAPLEVNALCRKIQEMIHTYYKDDIERLGIQVQLQVPDYPVTAVADAEKLSSTLMSMAANSLYALKKKFAAAQPGQTPLIRVNLQKGPNGKGCVISIYDNGTGIEETIQSKVFDPFFTTKPTAEAPGIGLYLCLQTIQDVGGSISLRSQKDEFTEFSIVLP